MSAQTYLHPVSIEAEDLVVSYGSVVALRIPKLSVRGRIIALVGHNGSGKSTLIKSILGLLAPKSGRIEASWHCDSEKHPMQAETDMAFAPEDGAVFEDLTVESYLKLWGRIRHRKNSFYRREGARYLERLEITPLLGKLGRELSKGQRRRVQCMVGFLLSPRLFLFDEPFDGLDIAQSNALADIMAEESCRMSLVLSSHRMDVVERLADSVIVLRNGQVSASGNLEQVCAKLCGSSVLISDLGGGCSEYLRQSLLGLVDLLRIEYRSCVVHQIGSRVSVTGKEVNADSLQAFLTANNRLNGFSISTAPPSLADAMQFHLKQEQ